MLWLLIQKIAAEVFRMQGKRIGAVISIILTCLAITVCDSQANSVPLSYDEAVKKVTFTGEIATVDFTNLNHHNIYLVKINSSDFVVPAGNTEEPAQALSVITSQDGIGTPVSPEDSFYSRFHRAIQEFNANPPPIDMEARRGAVLTAGSVSYTVGDKKVFWVEKYKYSDASTVWESGPAVLMASGVHGNIWVMDENTSSGKSKYKISKTQAEELAGKFDLIYPLTTNLLGYEYGGGPNGDGGVDGDKKIQMLIYDIVDESGKGVGVAGYFTSNDFYTQAELDNHGSTRKTNLAEIFYIDANQVIGSLDYTSSVLVHEFQHMINFNRKYVEHGVNSGSWYNEMLSMMAEDVIAPLIGVGRTHNKHPISVRIPDFLDSYYKYGITEWELAGDSYAVLYAFGAYLLRNYGGPELLKKILDNDMVNADSLTMALKEFSADMDFGKAINRYSEALIFSGSSIPEDGVNGINAATFDRTVSDTINGETYTAYGFNIWQTRRSGTKDRGPFVLDFEPAYMRPHSAIIQSTSQWRNKTGDYSITLEKPSSQNVVLYLMVR
jgi:hypothetical protein